MNPDLQLHENPISNTTQKIYNPQQKNPNFKNQGKKKTSNTIILNMQQTKEKQNTGIACLFHKNHPN